MSPRAGLDQKAVVQAAAELIDQHGLEQLTLARLAEQLGIRTPSLYNYVRGLGGLKRELALFATREITSHFRQAAVGKAGDEAILAFATAYRTYAKEHPGRYVFTQQVSEDEREDSELQIARQEAVDTILAVLTSYQLSTNEALHIVRGLRSIVHGFVSLETSGGFGLPLDLDESYYQLIKTFTSGLPQLQH